MKFKDIPKPARSYMIYHVLISPGLICWYLLPLYMMMTGYSPLSVGMLFSTASALSVILTYLAGKLFDRVSIKRGLVAIDIIDGAAYFFYFLAAGPLSGLFLLIGRLLEEASFILYPLYPAYERIIYPKQNRTQILSWHLRLPEISQIISFPIIGYLLGYVFTKPFHYRIAFLMTSLFSVFTVWYLIKFLAADREREKLSGESFSFKFSPRFWKFIFVDCVITLAGSLTPALVLINYVINKLHKTLFEITLIEAAMSAVVIAATYLSDRIKPEREKTAIILGLSIISASFFLISLGANFAALTILYSAARFGSTIMFPHYRSWMWSFIPPKSSAQIHGALNSLRRVIEISSPALAGLLATAGPSVPYNVSASLYAAAAGSILLFKKL